MQKKQPALRMVDKWMIYITDDNGHEYCGTIKNLRFPGQEVYFLAKHRDLPKGIFLDLKLPKCGNTTPSMLRQELFGY